VWSNKAFFLSIILSSFFPRSEQGGHKESFNPEDEGDMFLRKSALTRETQRLHVPEDSSLHFYRRENIKRNIALTGWALLRRHYVSPVRYELDFYIPEDDILHSDRRENLKSYITLTSWPL
jgi:hypothetical protein